MRLFIWKHKQPVRRGSDFRIAGYIGHSVLAIGRVVLATDVTKNYKMYKLHKINIIG
jgi:hypothetical protein